MSPYALLYFKGFQVRSRKGIRITERGREGRKEERRLASILHTHTIHVHTGSADPSGGALAVEDGEGYTRVLFAEPGEC